MEGNRLNNVSIWKEKLKIKEGQSISIRAKRRVKNPFNTHSVSPLYFTLLSLFPYFCLFRSYLSSLHPDPGPFLLSIILFVYALLWVLFWFGFSVKCRVAVSIYSISWDFCVFELLGFSCSAEKKQRRECVGVWLMDSDGICFLFDLGSVWNAELRLPLMFYRGSVWRFWGFRLLGSFLYFYYVFTSYFLFVCWESIGKRWEKVLSYGLSGFSLSWVELEKQESRRI